MKTYTQKELADMLDRHAKWLRGDPSGSRADLAGADLARAYLAGADLANAYLARANLAGADLAGAYLAGADLAGADLADAYLAGADLAGANLVGANLADAYLARANLARANLAGANLAGANLAGAKKIEKLPQMQALTLNEYIALYKIKTDGEWLWAFKGTNGEKSPQRTGTAEVIKYEDGAVITVPFGNADIWTSCGHGINLSPTADQAKKWGNTVKLIKVNKGDVICIPVEHSKFRVKRCEVIETVK